MTFFSRPGHAFKARIFIRSVPYVCLIVGLDLLAAGARAQTPPAGTGDLHAAALAQGWAALAKGDLSRAAAEAQRAIAGAPRSPAALALVVEVEIVRGGALAGLDAYEKWLGAKKVDEPYVLRRIAEAHLQVAVRRRDSGIARVEALKALAADGDATVIASLAAATPQPGAAETGLLATLGDERAIRTLIDQLQSHPGKLSAIKALADSGSPLAVRPLLAVLAEGRDDDRAAAADALAQLGAAEAIPHITPLFEHPNFTVKITAAAALYRLGDDTGAQFLDELLASDHAGVRLGAAEALSVRPGGPWLDVLRVLASDPSESIQLGAARLLAPHDRDLADRVLRRLGSSENPAIREEAGRILAEQVANDFGVLRRLLRHPDAATAVRAAGRILELTR